MRVGAKLKSAMLGGLALAAVAAPAAAEVPLPSNCWWVPWYDIMSWYYGVSGYCIDGGGLWWFDDSGGYGKGSGV